MALKHRIENLESKQLPPEVRTYVVVSKYGESRDEAIQRFCNEKGITVEELDNLPPGSRVGIVRFLKPSDIGDSFDTDVR